MPVWHRPDLKQALSTLRQLKDKEDAPHQQKWSQSYSSSWWNWQGSWWHSSCENHHEDVPAPIDQGNLIEKWLSHFFEVWFSEFNCVITVGSFTADGGLLSPTGCVNTKPPILQNIHKNNYEKSHEKQMSWTTASETKLGTTCTTSRTTCTKTGEVLYEKACMSPRPSPKKQESTNNSTVIRWTFFQSLSMSSRREDLMVTDMVTSRETRNTLRLTN